MAKKIHQRGLLLGTMNTKAAGDCAPILLFAALLIFAGISPARLRASDATLRPGDMIDLKLGGVPSTETQSVSGQYQIDADGFVNMPNIGKVRIGGLSPAAAETAIEHVYTAKEIYTHPTIIITMQPQSRWVNVGGEVKAPERVPYTPDLTVLSCINAAGGFSPYADQMRVPIARHPGNDCRRQKDPRKSKSRHTG
jgi:protein involved in polysaccharide export with SLBB domain